jgi:hypothetical protein
MPHTSTTTTKSTATRRNSGPAFAKALAEYLNAESEFEFLAAGDLSDEAGEALISRMDAAAETLATARANGEDARALLEIGLRRLVVHEIEPEHLTLKGVGSFEPMDRLGYCLLAAALKALGGTLLGRRPACEATHASR